MDGTRLPELHTEVPGPASRAHVDRLARHECPAITARRAGRARTLGAADDDPIVWAEARGANIVDVDGNRYVDLTSGFGVALVGHRHPAVVRAASAQSERLVHAMGDAFPDVTRVALLEQLAALTPGTLDVSILGLSGSDAVDAAVKTARIATGRSGVLAFSGGYHGLALGVLGLQGYKAAFTEPFADITHPDVRHLPWACDPERVQDALSTGEVGLVIVEPVLGRGGMRTPPTGWLSSVAAVTRAAGALVCFDEIQSGMGRTGSLFAGPDQGVVPDLMCVGKALGGGFPISACVGTPEVMAAWGPSSGEALHTQTFLGHPVGCAAALAVLELVRGDLLDRVRDRSSALDKLFPQARGIGLMRAIDLGPGIDALAVSRELLRRGFLVLPADAHSLGLTPPVTLTDQQLQAFADALDAIA